MTCVAISLSGDGRDDEHLGLPSHDGLARTPDGTALMARRLKLEHRLQHRVSARTVRADPRIRRRPSL
jgi:hypothetical protein